MCKTKDSAYSSQLSNVIKIHWEWVLKATNFLTYQKPLKFTGYSVVFLILKKQDTQETHEIKIHFP